MKKLLFLITSILTIGSACFAVGCHGNQGGPKANNERSYVVERQDEENQPSEDDGDCKDSECDDSDCDKVKIEPIKPHKKHPREHNPAPRPMPVKPRK